MNKKEYLLIKLAEECNEVGKDCAKANIFGLNDSDPADTTKTSNKDKIIQEFYELCAVVEMLQEENILPIIDEYDAFVRKQQKKEKVEKYMEYSRKVGTLID